jgi:hypothetical protein
MKADALASRYCKHGKRQQSHEQTDHQPSTQVSIAIKGLTSEIEGGLRFHINDYPCHMVHDRFPVV